MKRIAIFLTAIIALTGCWPSQKEYDSLLKENEILKRQLDSCKIEIANYRDTPERIYNSATKYIVEKDTRSLGEVVRKLEKYHPTSKEYIKAKETLQKLIEERDAAKKKEREERRGIVNKLKRKHDDISGTTWYHNPYFTHTANSNHVSVYIGKKESEQPYLRLLMSYYGENWIFFDKAYLSYDGNTKQISFNEFNDKKTENNTKCWEWIDVNVDKETLAFLKKMVEGKSVKMRLTGKYQKDHTLTATEIKAIKDVLLGYDVLKNGI